MAGEGDTPQGTPPPVSTGVPAKMKVGFNYPWAYESYGAQIGPDPWVSPWDTEWPRQEALAALGKVGPPDIPMPALFTNVERNLRSLKTMGVQCVRWFLLGNFFSYGVGGAQRKHHLVPPGCEIWDYEFTPPAKPDNRYKFHFEELLKVFKKVGMEFMPSFCDFGIVEGNEHGVDRKGIRVAGRRADCISDPKKRDVLLAFMQELVDVAARKDYEGVVMAWDVCNEPYWMSSAIFGLKKPPPFIVRRDSNLTIRQGVMHQQTVIQFLEAALKIVKGKLKSTVGHRYWDDLSIYPTGDIPQFHYYATKLGVPPGYAPIPLQVSIDPKSIPKVSGNNRPILGEFAVQSANYSPWEVPDPDVPGFLDRNTYERLKLLEAKGYQTVFLWNQAVPRPKKTKAGKPILDPKGDQVYKVEDWVKLKEDERQQLVKYTGGTFVPMEAPELDADER
jgi:hypothetical protein